LYFAAAGHASEAAKARRLAARVARGLGSYWSEKEQCFAFARDMKGTPAGGLSKSYPHGLAQLFALAHVAPERATLWQELRKRFKPGDDGMPVERWLMAATRCATAEETKELRRATLTAMLRFTTDNVYVDRPALAILAIIDGKARFPDISRARP
jgi:hypothetical protein